MTAGSLCAVDPSLLSLSPLILGSLIATFGLLALVISFFGRRRVDPLLPWVGVFAMLWGVRLLVGTPLASAFGVSRLSATWIGTTITYAVYSIILVSVGLTFVRRDRTLRSS